MDKLLPRLLNSSTLTLPLSRTPPAEDIVLPSRRKLRKEVPLPRQTAPKADTVLPDLLTRATENPDPSLKADRILTELPSD